MKCYITMYIHACPLACILQLTNDLLLLVSLNYLAILAHHENKVTVHKRIPIDTGF